MSTRALVLVDLRERVWVHAFWHEGIAARFRPFTLSRPMPSKHASIQSLVRAKFNLVQILLLPRIAGTATDPTRMRDTSSIRYPHPD